MDINKTFLQLTKFTYGLGDEQKLEQFFPKNVQMDEAGNYFTIIGESETMFTCHMDTVASGCKPVIHMKFHDKKTDSTIYCTDQSTILGADDKAGMTILLHMIENKIPGLYYFFRGEEHGCIGSRSISDKKPEFFKKYKRCISFDRRGYGSIISRQSGKQCCSSTFVEALSKQFESVGMDYHDDPTGIFTDSFQFVTLISECTNLSVGYFSEHSVNESQNIDYLIKLSKAVLKIDWESLPAVRDYKPFDTAKPNRLNKGKFGFSDEDLISTFKTVDEILERVLFASCLNYKFFEPEKEMVYETYGTNSERISVYINDDGIIKVGTTSFNNVEELLQYAEKEFNYVHRDYTDYESFFNSLNNLENEESEIHNKYIQDFLYFFDLDLFKEDINAYKLMSDNKTISFEDMNHLLKVQSVTIEELIDYLHIIGNKSGNMLGITFDDDTEEFLID